MWICESVLSKIHVSCDSQKSMFFFVPKIRYDRRPPPPPRQQQARRHNGDALLVVLFLSTCHSKEERRGRGGMGRFVQLRNRFVSAASPANLYTLFIDRLGVLCSFHTTIRLWLLQQDLTMEHLIICSKNLSPFSTHTHHLAEHSSKPCLVEGSVE